MTATDLVAQKPPEKEVKKKLPYPKSVFFIISNEFCERFSYYGMRTILALYLHNGLGYTEDMSTLIYHVFVMLCYFTPLIGGIMADSWLGKYKTILYVSILYAIGNIVLALGSVKALPISHRALSLVGLFLIATGTGGIKPCVSSFGGDQFQLPEQERQLQSFFSVFYFSINAGSVLSCFFTPMMREDVTCLGQDTCDPLAFGVPAILMIVSIVFFVAGSFMYKMKDPEGNIMALVCKCIWHALSRRRKERKTLAKAHWLDYADDKYSVKLIEETKIFLNLAYLFSPTIVFWALYEQQGSRWTFQASHMNGAIGGFNMDPDQVQTLNPVMVLIFIPIFDKWLYPLLAKLRVISTPLQKLSWGGMLAALAFLVSGILEFSVQDSYPVMVHSGNGLFWSFNTAPCDARLGAKGLSDITVKSWDSALSPTINLPKYTTPFAFEVSCANYTASLNADLYRQQVASFLISKDGGKLTMDILNLEGIDELQKSNTTKVKPKFKFIYGLKGHKTVSLKRPGAKDPTISLPMSGVQTTMNDTTYGVYKVLVDGTELDGDLDLITGGVYFIMLGEEQGKLSFKSVAVTKPNTVHMLWQVPQYLIISFAEIMFSITGMEFSFTQSPESMKSVISSLWLITDAFGNVIILIIEGINIFDNKAYEFFLYAGIMALVMLVFIYLATQYKYVTLPKDAMAQEEALANIPTIQRISGDPPSYQEAAEPPSSSAL